MSWQLISIIIGIVGALFGVYFKESVNKAYVQKLIATRLEGYLMNLQNDILSDIFFKAFFVVGELWNEELYDAAIKGESEAFAKINEKYMKSIENAKNDPATISLIKHMYDLYRGMDEELFQDYIKGLDQLQSCLIDDKFFITDEEAAKISWYAVARTIAIKDYSLRMIRRQKAYVKLLRKMETLNAEAVKYLQHEIVKNFIMFSKNVTPLHKTATTIRKSNILKLTLKNIFD